MSNLETGFHLRQNELGDYLVSGLLQLHTVKEFLK